MAATRLFLVALACAHALHAPRLPATRRNVAKAAAPISLLPAAMPSASTLTLAAALPTALGFWRTGYAVVTVSYGYGGAVAASAALYLKAGASGVGKAHALALVFYGLRLNACRPAFLLYRQLFTSLPGMTAADVSLKDRITKRLPVLTGCAFLFYCLATPLRATAAVASEAPLLKALVGLAWAGFGLGAVGDVYKSAVKAMKGADHLVTGGPFYFLRHPNYTGELLGWAASFAAAAVATYSSGLYWLAPWAFASAVGLAGIYVTLAGEAAAGLEKKQAAKYGGSAAYEAWVSRSWPGPVLVPKPKAPALRTPDPFERYAWSGPVFP